MPKYYIKGVRLESVEINRDNDKGTYVPGKIEASLIASNNKVIAGQDWENRFGSNKLSLSPRTNTALDELCASLSLDAAISMGLDDCET